MLVCVAAFILTFAASNMWLLSLLRFTMFGTDDIFLLGGLITLTCIDQDNERHTFGNSGGLQPGFGFWFGTMVGVLIYVFYGRRHSLLLNAIYVLKAHADEIYRSSRECT